MSTKKSTRVAGRPRNFDPEQVVSTAQALFHEKGYDALSIADVTEHLGIKPPSLYGAFGNKVKLFNRVLERYAETDAIPLADLLRDDLPLADCLSALLEDATRRYSKNDACRGCISIEGVRCNDPEARDVASAFYEAAQERIYQFIAARCPEHARSLTDYISTVMSGLSFQARQGQSTEQLLATARIASHALKAIIA